MHIHKMTVGPLEANAYIVYENKSKAFVIDPGAEPDNILKALDGLGIETLTHILLTHGHFDHIGAVADIEEKTGAKVCIHSRDAGMLKSDVHSLAVFTGGKIKKTCAQLIFKGGETINAADIEVKVLHTPGHSGGSVCYIAGENMFSGDTLFYRGIGRTDFPGSNESEYRHSLNITIRELGHDYKVYSGHGIDTTLYSEFANNPFFTT